MGAPLKSSQTPLWSPVLRWTTNTIFKTAKVPSASSWSSLSKAAQGTRKQKGQPLDWTSPNTAVAGSKTQVALGIHLGASSNRLVVADWGVRWWILKPSPGSVGKSVLADSRGLPLRIQNRCCKCLVLSQGPREGTSSLLWSQVTGGDTLNFLILLRYH